MKPDYNYEDKQCSPGRITAMCDVAQSRAEVYEIAHLLSHNRTALSDQHFAILLYHNNL